MDLIRYPVLAAAFAVALTAPPSFAAAPPAEIDWMRKPGEEWRSSPVRTLESLDGFSGRTSPPRLSRFGGNRDGERREATGFFRTEKVDGRWWTIDPEGYPYIHIGLTSVRPTRHASSREIFPRKFRGNADWARETVTLMRELGFNELGRWSRTDLLNEVEPRIPYTTSATFMGAFGRELALTSSSYGHLVYRENVIPVFHPRFERFAFEYAREQLAEMKDDPWLVGHFTDNELPMPRDLLTRTLAIDPEDPELGANVRAAWRWFHERRGEDATAESATAEDNLDWLGHVMDRYYAITAAAIRAATPNHMNLGSRLHGAGPHIPQVIAAAGRHLDIVSVNYYNSFAPSDRHLGRWTDHSAAPVLITEFYIKGEDAAEKFGLNNRLGAGWIVRTQADRGHWYQNFTLRILESPQLVGWQYFKYADEADDSNKGILDPRYEPYRELTAAMRSLNRNAYELADYFERRTR